jgi:predicted MFS family arabinose efflux permease
MLTTTATQEPSDRGRYKWLVLALLCAAYTFSMIDRQLPFILAQSIRKDLHLTDTQIGLLGGIFFAGTYALVSVPLARLADLFPRKLIISGAVTFWCLMTGLGGLTASFIQLSATRIGVAVGEAGLVPATHSMIADYFSPRRRATAIAIFSIGLPLGAMLGLFLGGWLNEVTNWRTALMLVGLPGVVLGMLFLFVREPKRGGLDPAGTAGASTDIPTFVGTFGELWSRRSFRHMIMGLGLYSFGAASKIAFAPSFLMRSHGLSSSQTGAALGLVVGISGFVGILAGGFAADALGKSDKRWYIWLSAICILLAAPCLAVAFLAPTATVALIFLVPSYGLGNLHTAPVYAMVQALVRSRARAMAIAVLMSCQFLIGNSLGPAVIGAISDALMPIVGDKSLGYALAITSLTNVWGFVHLLFAAKHLRADLARAGS